MILINNKLWGLEIRDQENICPSQTRSIRGQGEFGQFNFSFDRFVLVVLFDFEKIVNIIL